MTVQIGILFLIILVYVVALVKERYPPDTLSLILCVVLIACNFVTPKEGISGFSNEAAIAVLSLMILSVGLETTGVITTLGQRLKGGLKGPDWRIILLLMVMVGSCSAFLSTTAVVIVFMRIVIKLSKELPLNLAVVLMPLSFAGILGGSCTLLGTSTNLLVSAIALDHGMPRFGVFEFVHLGVVFFVVGIVFMTFVGVRLIKSVQHEDELTTEYAIQDYFTEAIVEKGSNLIGKSLNESPFFKEMDIDLLEIKQRGQSPHFPIENEIFKEGDILLIKGSMEKMASLRRNNQLTLRSADPDKVEDRLNTREMTLCEVIVRPNSRLVGQTMDKVSIRRDYDAVPLAVKKHQKYFATHLENLIIEAGDTILMEVGRANFKRFYNLPEFVVLQEHEDLSMKSRKGYVAGFIMLFVIVVASTGLISILVSALIGCVLMFLTGCLDLQKAYRRVDWSVYFLLAGMIPLGIAMGNTGASQWIASQFTAILQGQAPYFLIGALFLVTMLLSSVISNNATAILIAPIAISIGTELNMDIRPLLFTVMFAANMSFISPMGYQTNALIYGTGEYRMTDFMKVGGGLSFIIWILATIMISAWYF